MKNTYILFNIFVFFCLCNVFVVRSFKLNHQNGVLSHDKDSSDEKDGKPLSEIISNLKKSMKNDVEDKSKEKDRISFSDKSEQKEKEKDEKPDEKLKKGIELLKLKKKIEEEINNNNDMHKDKHTDEDKKLHDNEYKKLDDNEYKKLDDNEYKKLDDNEYKKLDDNEYKKLDDNDNEMDESRRGIIENNDNTNKRNKNNMKINNTIKNEDISEDHALLSILQQMDSSEALKIAYDGFKTTFAEIAYERLKKNPSEEFDEDLITKEITKAGYGVFLQGQNKAMFVDWLKEKWDKVKSFAKQSFDKLKELAKNTGFAKKIKDYLKDEALPKGIEFLKNISAKELPQVEQIMADSIKKLDPTLQKVVYPSIVTLFNKLEKYLGVTIKDSVFAPHNNGEERILPPIKDEEDSEEIKKQLSNENISQEDKSAGKEDAPESVKKDWQDALEVMQSNQ